MARQVASVMRRNRKRTAVRVPGTVAEEITGWGLSMEPGPGGCMINFFLAEDGILHSMRVERRPEFEEDFRWHPFIRDVSLLHSGVGNIVAPSDVSHALVRLLD